MINTISILVHIIMNSWIELINKPNTELIRLILKKGILKISTSPDDNTTIIIANIIFITVINSKITADVIRPA